MRPRSSSTIRLLPLPGLALRVPIRVGAVLEDDGNGVQTAEIRGVAVVVRSTAIADRSSLEELPRFLRDLFSNMRLSFRLRSVRTRHTASREEGVQESRWQRRPSRVGGLIPGAGPRASGCSVSRRSGAGAGSPGWAISPRGKLCHAARSVAPRRRAASPTKRKFTEIPRAAKRAHSSHTALSPGSSPRGATSSHTLPARRAFSAISSST